SSNIDISRGADRVGEFSGCQSGFQGRIVRFDYCHDGLSPHWSDANDGDPIHLGEPLDVVFRSTGAQRSGRWRDDVVRPAFDPQSTSGVEMPDVAGSVPL